MADAHDSETQLKTAEIVPQHALDPVLCHRLGRLCILFEANLEDWLDKGESFLSIESITFIWTDTNFPALSTSTRGSMILVSAKR